MGYYIMMATYVSLRTQIKSWKFYTTTTISLLQVIWDFKKIISQFWNIYLAQNEKGYSWICGNVLNPC
jgi:hypothetical protein